MIRTGATRTLLPMLLATGILCGVAGAQSVPPDRDALEQGSGGGMASYADPNDFPGPKHILDLADTLRLSEDQIKQIEAIADAMSAESRSLGMRIIEREETLEELFRTGTALEGQTRSIAVEIGTLRGRLRAVHLIAHIQARDILAGRQRDLYTSLRYGRQTTAGKLNAGNRSDK
jgi:hypothetical protein